MKPNLPQMIDSYADASAKYRVAVETGASEEQIVYLKRKMRLNGWALRDLGLDVQFDDTDN